MPDKNFEEWRDVHQKFELDYHRAENYRWKDEEFLLAWETNFAGFLGLPKDHFSDDSILLDVGCGSRPALSYFTRGMQFNVEPLGLRYMEIPQIGKYWRQEDIALLAVCPAETQLTHLVGRCDFVNCWNVLDHCYDWRAVLKNLFAYAKPGAIISICTDLKAHGDGHPGIDSPADLFNIIFQECDMLKLEVNYGETVSRDIAMKMNRW